jgi:protein gp37
MGVTSIEWTDRVWNPTSGCTKVSAGCDRCYAEGISRRFAGTKAFPNGFEVTLHPDRIEDPLYWRRPAKVFVNSMSDLFHADIPTDFLHRVFDVMERATDHQFQVLTKRPGPMRAFITAREAAKAACAAQFDHCPTPGMRDSPAARQARYRAAHPPANIWLGVSVEDQKTADLRIPQLLRTPAAVRFISAEPLLGPVDLSDLLLRRCPCCHGEPHGEPFDDGGCGPCDDAGCDGGFMRGLDWVIVGGESGSGARPMDLGWAKDIVDQCRQEHVPVFVKQLGSACGRQHKDIERFPRALQVRQFPRLAPVPTAAAVMAGRA